ncbi:MAG: family 2A encapsulin nanocompartment cargo protein cysteine desulfurase [Candidatus Sumerlaeia bacterium]|nr:family 2A encapsulin nanocompartment cargo protein cysteine desulfurase [Candidatus Sumerlaeia bacterium]
MTTNDLDAYKSGVEFDAETLLGKVPQGLPDVGELTRLANAFFRESTESGSFVSHDGLSLLSLPLSEPNLRDDSHFSTPVLPTVSPINSKSVAPIPSTSGAFSPNVVDGALSSLEAEKFGGFGFLAEARSLFSSVPIGSVNKVSSLAPSVFTSAQLTDLENGINGDAVPFISTVPAEISSPNLPGLDNKHLGIPGLDFIDLIRPLSESAGIGPTEVHTPSAHTIPSNSLFSSGIDVNAVRRDFPILGERVNGRPLIWLDNAATTQKPSAVIDRLKHFYEHENSNIHRAAHELAARSTDAYEGAREKARRFLNASSVNEIIFVRGATEGINLIAQSWGKKNIQKGDEIVLSILEHHANIVPWQMLCAESGAKIRVAPVDDHGQIILEEYERLLNHRTKLVAVTQVSNALGTITPVEEMVAAAHRHGARVLIDGSQAVSHMKVDVQRYDCDFYVFSGHKVFAPTGIGVVFGKNDILQQTPPWQGGGNMIADVTFERTVYQPAPFRFEAGTGNIADAVGLGAAIDYVEKLGMHNIARYEHDLLVYGIEALSSIPGLRLIGTAKEKASVLSFVLEGYRSEDVGTALNREGIAVRSGHHCAQPILRRFGLESTVRPSLAFYNTCEEIDALVSAIWNLKSGIIPSVV